MSLELAMADKIVAPTNWQRNQLPTIFKDNCDVIFDGIDESVFYLQSSPKTEKPIITYGTRGMDPMRGFPQFIKTIPKVLNHNPSCLIEIAGKDETFYGLKSQVTVNMIAGSRGLAIT